MRILVVASTCDMSGGSERSMLTVVDHLRQRHGIDCEVLVPRRSGDLVAALSQRGIVCIPAPYQRTYAGHHGDAKDLLRLGRSLASRVVTLTVAPWLAWRMRDAGYDLVYTNTLLPDVGAAIARRLRVPHVVHVREIAQSFPGWPWWSNREIATSSHHLIFISEAARKAFGVQGIEAKSTVIHNGIEDAVGTSGGFSESRSTLECVAVGRLVPSKGQKDAIEAVRILRDRGFAKVRLHIVGRAPVGSLAGRYARSLERMIEQYGLQDLVIMHGQVSNMTSFRRDKDVELVCSKAEAFGRVTIEAMRAGLLVIGANAGATPELVSSGRSGYLYERGNAVDLAELLEFVARNRPAARSVAYVGRAQSSVFTPSRCGDSVSDVLRSLSDAPVSQRAGRQVDAPGGEMVDSHDSSRGRTLRTLRHRCMALRLFTGHRAIGRDGR